MNAAAHPSTVISACARSLSCSGAEVAIAAAAPASSTATASKIASMVRRLRRPSSAAVSNLRCSTSRSADTRLPSRRILRRKTVNRRRGSDGRGADARGRHAHHVSCCSELLARVGLWSKPFFSSSLLACIAARVLEAETASEAHSRDERSQLLRLLAESGVLRHTLDRLLRRRYRGVQLSC